MSYIRIESSQRVLYLTGLDVMVAGLDRRARVVVSAAMS